MSIKNKSRTNIEERRKDGKKPNGVETHGPVGGKEGTEWKPTYVMFHRLVSICCRLVAKSPKVVVCPKRDSSAAAPRPP